MVNVDSMSRSV